MNVIYSILILLLSITWTARGEPLVCNDGAELSSDATSHCECVNDGFYNAFTGKCEGICEFFGDNVCGFGCNATCVQHPNNATGFDCECKSGYEPTDDHEVCKVDLACADANECEEGGIQCQVNMHEKCVNQDGGDICVCEEGFFRNAAGECQDLDLCNIQNSGNICYQGCNYANQTYECFCYEGFILYKDNMCIIDGDNGYTECQCDEDTEVQDCAQRPDGTQLCYPSPGFQFASDNATIVDINECEEMTYQCPRGSNCVNDYGAYHCECFQYYHQVDPENEMDECVPITCVTGKTLVNGICIDPCLDLDITCPELSLCYTDEYMVPKCQCQVACQNDGLSYNSTFSIYALTFYLPFEKLTDYFWSQKKFFLTRSMEAIFGRGNAEIVDCLYPLHDGLNLTFRVGVQNPVSRYNEIGDVILRNCYSLYNSTAEHCVLPGNFVVNRYSIMVQEITNCEGWSVCDDYENSKCDESNLSPGRFRCICNEGYEEAPDLYVTFCQDINECITGDHNCTDGFVCVNQLGNYSCEYDNASISTLQSNLDDLQKQLTTEEDIEMDLKENLDDQEHDTTVIGATLGAVFGVAFIAFVVASVYTYRIRMRIKNKKDQSSTES